MLSYKDVRPCTFAPLAATRPQHDAGAAESEAPTGPGPEEVAAAARAEGFAQGYYDGLAQVRETQRRSTRRVVRLSHRALVDADRLTRSVEEEVMRLGLAVAERVIEREVQMDRTTVLGVVRAALKEMQRAPIVQVRVNAEDYAILSAHWEDVAPRSVNERAHLIADDEIEPGGCIVEMRHGQADARLQTKLDQISQAFDALFVGDLA